MKIPGGYEGTVAEIETISNAAIEKLKPGGIVPYTSPDGELIYEGLDIVQAIIEVKNATLELCNKAKVPEKYWNDAPSPIKAPTLSGVGDGAITELKDIPELVGFGLQIATEPEVAKGIWNGIKSLSPSKVKKMLIGAGTDKLKKYTDGGNTMKHEVGKDGVQLAMFVFGGVTKIKDGAELIDDLGEAVVKKLDDVAEESLEIISGSVDELAGKSINKFVKENDLNGNFLDYESQTLSITKNKKGSKLNEAETQEILNREKSFVEVGDLDEIAGTGSTFKKGTTGGWNKEINKHPFGKNREYISESLNEKYITDGSGRVQQVEIESLSANSAKANGYQRRKAITAKGGIADDQGGHLLAARFGGAGEQINLVPMKKSINQAGGSWYQMEQDWANVLSQAGGKVEKIKIKILDYDANGRPGRFEVECKINGVLKPFIHLN